MHEENYSPDYTVKETTAETQDKLYSIAFCSFSENRMQRALALLNKTHDFKTGKESTTF